MEQHLEDVRTKWVTGMTNYLKRENARSQSSHKWKNCAILIQQRYFVHITFVPLSISPTGCECKLNLNARIGFFLLSAFINLESQTTGKIKINRMEMFCMHLNKIFLLALVPSRWVIAFQHQTTSFSPHEKEVSCIKRWKVVSIN